MAHLTGYTQVFAGDTSVVDTAAQHPLRTRAFDTEGNEYIYLQGVASTVLYSPVVYDEAGLTVLADSAGTAPSNEGPIAVAQAAIVADRYGWYMIHGKTYMISGDVADNGQIYLTTGAGTVDDADVAQALVIGAWARGADDSDNTRVLVQINYPMVHRAAID
ncbi:MAG: hypothetical protein WCW77_00525 [Patescibacteria group bacterium]|jgi:hypothetical protein